MKIYVNEVLEKQCLEVLRKYLTQEERTGIHVSDLVNPRQAFFKRVDPKPITDREVGYFITGKVLHLIVQDAFGVKTERRVYVNGVEGHEDLPLLRDTMAGEFEGNPTEFKTSRKWSIPEVPEPHYIDQEKCYCAMENALDLTKGLKGQIWVLYLTPGRKFDGSVATYPIFRMWTLEFTLEELSHARAEMDRRKTLFVTALDETKKALAENKPVPVAPFKALPLCLDWMCGTKNKKTGKAEVSCQWFKLCQPEGRYDAVTGGLVV